MSHSRNVRLDLLRLLGVVLIMISHAGPPGWLFPIRYYGTPLLIVASALTYAFIYANRRLDAGTFYPRRLVRLILPAWTFLTFFFLVFLLSSAYPATNFPFTTSQVLGSYTFYSGIGFVWILKLYIILALLTPVALKLSQSGVSNTRYFLAIAAVYVLHEALLGLLQPRIPGQMQDFLNTVVFILVPYGALYVYGMRLASLTNRQVVLAATAALGIFLAMAAFKYLEAGYFVPSVRFKYPPTSYYLSYAFFAANMVYLVCRNAPSPRGNAASAITWLAANSLWIYLWHIMAFYLWHFQFGSQPGSLSEFAVKLIFLLGFSIAVTFLQVSAVKRFMPADHPVGRRLAAVLT